MSIHEGQDGPNHQICDGRTEKDNGGVVASAKRLVINGGRSGRKMRKTAPPARYAWLDWVRVVQIEVRTPGGSLDWEGLVIAECEETARNCEEERMGWLGWTV